MADNSLKIAELQAILRAGARRVVIDGTTVEYDFDTIRNELRKLQADDDNNSCKRPVVSTMDLTGF